MLLGLTKPSSGSLQSVLRKSYHIGVMRLSHSALCVNTHTKQDCINMRPHDRTV